jgi:hypothetical protein
LGCWSIANQACLDYSRAGDRGSELSEASASVKGRLHAVLMIGVVARATVAFAQGDAQSRFALEWNVPQGCLDRDDARAAIERALGTSAAARNPATVVRVTIAEASNERWNADIWMYDANGSGERSVEGATCAQAAQATTLIVALALADGPTLAPDTQVAKPAAAHLQPAERVRVGIGARLIGDVGSLPGPDLGLALLLVLQHRGLRAEAEGSGFWPRIAHDAPAANSGGRFYLLSGGLRGCIDLVPAADAALRLGPCAGAEVGATFANGVGALGTRRSSVVFWAAGLLGLSARYLGRGPLWLGILAELGLPLHRAAWQVDDVAGTVFQPKPVVGRVSLSVGWFIP